MLYAQIDGVRRGPIAKGERAVCACGAELIAVLPTQNVKHWRHPAGDCDPWSEPEGPWHLGWKERFEIHNREVELIDGEERHRADILVVKAGGKGTVVELQHSPIGDDERGRREAFYTRHHKMFWLIHLHNEHAFHRVSFDLSLSYQIRREKVADRVFTVMRWAGSSKQFIEKWKQSNVHVFFDSDAPPYLAYLATHAACRELVARLRKGEFAVCFLTHKDFIEAVSSVRAS